MMILQRVLRVFREEGIQGIIKRLEKRYDQRFGKQYSALTVDHNQAMKYFEGHKDVFEDLVSAVAPHIPRDGVIFDIGANIGYFSLMLSQRLNFSGTVYLFEVVPHLAELCKQTFAASPFKVHVLAYGLSDEDAEEDLFIADDRNIGWNTLVAEKASSDMTKVAIQLKAFENCGIDALPSFVKIDVEGAEYKVLGGMIGAMKNWNKLPVILCEVGWGRSHPHWDEETAVFEQMEKIGYSICDLDGSLVDWKNFEGTNDILFIPEKDRSYE